jgi:hypothetical protein
LDQARGMLLLELHGRQIAERRVQSAMVINLVDKSAGAALSRLRNCDSQAFRGLELRVIATAAMSSVLCALRSVPLGKYWRGRPLKLFEDAQCEVFCCRERRKNFR